MKRFFYGILAGAVLSVPSVSSAKDIQQFIINGQSLSTGHQSWPVVSTENVPGNYMMGAEIWINGGTGYSHGYDGNHSWAINPLVGTMSHAFKEFDNNSRNGGAIAECPLLGAVNHMQLSFLKGQDILATSVGVSGAAVEELSKECTQRDNYRHFRESLSHAVEEAGKAGYDAITCPAVFWMQGEFNYDVKNGHCGLNAGEDNCTDKKTYKALMLKLKENMQQDIKAAYGQEQAPVWITYQVGAQYVRDKVAIGMAQLEAANENDDVVMAGSPYPYTDRGGHLDANGYRWFGEMLAKAYYKSRVLGERVIPLQPKKITRENGGKTIRVKYYVPVGPMVFDTDLLPEIANYGFNVYHNGYGGSARQNISSIAIEGDDVVMTFDQPLTGKVVVTYADPQSRIKNQPEGLNHLQGHGNLRDSDPYKSMLTYIDLDAKNADGTYVYSRNEAETRLRPDYEPRDADGNVIYGKPYPLYNFGVAFYYTLEKKVDELIILDDDNRPVPVEEREPGTLDVAYVDAVNGSDGNDGSVTAPFASLTKAMASVRWDGAKVIVSGNVEIADELNLEGYTALAIEGAGNGACIDGMGATRLAETERVDISLRNITFTNFFTNGAGGVLSMNGGNLYVENCYFIDNSTSRMANENGGVFSLRNCGDVVIDGCCFENNMAFLGGAIYTYLSKQVTVDKSVFDANKSIKNEKESNNNSRGGAMSIWGTNVDIDGCVFTRNESSNQCGVFQLGWTNIAGQHFTVRNSDILDNKAPKDHGGVLVAENCGQRDFEYNFINCTISGNTNNACGSVAWVQNDNNVSPTQTLNIYNCTITGNHTNGNTFHSTIFLWESNLKINIVNTILEGNTTGGNKEYSDLHAGEYTEAKSANINISHSVLGRFYALRQDNTAGQERGVPVIDDASKFNISPYSMSQGVANHAGLLPRNEEGAHIFATTGSNGVGMGDDSLLADKYGVTTDRFGNERKLNCIGSVELIEGYTTGLQLVTAEDSRLALRLDGDYLSVSSEIYGAGVTLEVYTVDGHRLISRPMMESDVALRASQIGRGLRVLRVASSSTARTVVFHI